MMNLKLKELGIEENISFSEDKLDRKKYGEILTEIVSACEQGVVISLNGEWGTGKTTFVRMWQNMLENGGFKTLYFNAWETDYLTDPMIGLIGKFYNSEIFETNKKYADIFKGLSKIALDLFKGYIRHRLGNDIVKTIENAGASIDEAANTFKSQIEEFEKDSKAIESFRKALKSLAYTYSKDKPIIFIVDELDRCNPTYSVKVLERIKHLFSIEKIIFVLSIDKKQLANSIRGYFGSDRIDADEYLRRFIDVEYNLPEPDREKFIEYLIDYFDIKSFYDRIGTSDSNIAKSDFALTATEMIKYSNLSLRQMEKLFSHYRLYLATVKDKNSYDPDLSLFLMYFRIADNSFYNDIINQSFTLSTFLDELDKRIPQKMLQKHTYADDTNNIYSFIARLVVSYNKGKGGEELYKIPLYPNSYLFENLKNLNSSVLQQQVKEKKEDIRIAGIYNIRLRIELLMNMVENY